MALAALIVGRWTPQGAAAAALAFGFIEASQILLQGLVLPNGSTVPVQWIQMIPYIATLIILAMSGYKTLTPNSKGSETVGSFAPRSLGKPF